MTIPTTPDMETPPTRANAPEDFDVQMDLFYTSFLAWTSFFKDSVIPAINTDVSEVNLDAIAVETSRQQVVNLELSASNAAIQAALSAAASATTGINPADYDAGDRLEVVPDGAGGKELAMVGGVPRQKIVTLTGTTPSLDLNAGQIFTITPTGSTTFSFDTTNLINVVGQGLPFYLIVTQSATAYGLAFPANVNWDNDEEPAPPGALQRGFYVGLYDAVSDTTFLWLTSRSAA